MAPTLVKALSLLSFVSAFTGVLATKKPVSSCDVTKKCVQFPVEVSLGKSTGGVIRDAILTNGTLPGPVLKLKVGDCVDFIVTNSLPYKTAVHFHGIRHLNTPWNDGAPGLTQTPIEPGDTYNYNWEADIPGVYFYHAHYKGQMMDGMVGGILIEPKDDAPKPFSAISASDVKKLEAAYKKVEPVFISDWSRFTFDEYFQIEKDANVDIACTDAIVLNGFGSTYCPGIPAIMASASPITPQLLGNTTLTAKGCIPGTNPRIQGNYTRNPAALPPQMYDVCTPFSGKNYTYTVDPASGWAAMTFINSGGFLQMKVTIDSHKLYVYENDGHFVQPQIVDQLLVAGGDRVSFFVKLDQAPANYQIRVANNGLNQVISGFGVLSYKGASGFAGVAAMNYGGISPPGSVLAFNPLVASPFPAQPVGPRADRTFVLDIQKNMGDPTFAWSWSLSGVNDYDHSRDDATPPLLYQDPSKIPESDLILRTKYNEWVDLIVKVQGPLAQPHPMHKHGNKFYVLGQGIGEFPWKSTAEAAGAGVPFNLANPAVVDGFTSPPANGNDTWMVFRYQADTPGAWFFHCHVQTHFSGGMALAILDAVDKWPTVPKDAGKICSGKGSDDGSDDEDDEDDDEEDGGYPGGSGDDDSDDSGSDSGSGGSDSTTSSYPTATAPGSGGPATYTSTAGIATYTGAAALVQTSLTSAFGLLAFFLAVYA